MISNSEFESIADLDLDPIKVKLLHGESGEGWPLEKVNAVEGEYRRFLYLMKKFPNEVTAPPVDVDTFWHYHILDTMKYAEDCQKVFGYFLHHFPYLGMRGEDDAKELQRAGERMRELYQAAFGAPEQALADAAWCGAAKPALDAAWCGAAQPAQDAAWCGAAQPAQDAAWCGAAQPAQDAAWCGAAKPAQHAAWCGAAKPAQDVAWCGAAKPAQDVAWCGAAKPAQEAAWCGAAKPATESAAALSGGDKSALFSARPRLAAA